MAGAVDRAYNEIRQQLLDGRLHPGDPLREEALATTLDVSRTPIREALRRLEQEGLIEYISNHGFTVTIWELDELRHLLEIRARIEGYLARLVVERATPAQVRRLRLLAEEMLAEVNKPTPDSELIAARNAQFHRLLLGAAALPRISSIGSSARDLSFIHRPHIKRKSSDLKRSLMQHLDIVSAIEARDAEWAEAAVRAHILGSWRVLRRAYEEYRGDGGAPSISA